MKVGDYVRTLNGIQQLKKENDIGWFFEKSMIIKPNSLEKFIIKSSPNIIDLIEVGDYVNGYKITDYTEIDKYNDEKILYADLSSEYIAIHENEIKSIVTKEMFESMEYKVVE